MFILEKIIPYIPRRSIFYCTKCSTYRGYKQHTHSIKQYNSIIYYVSCVSCSSPATIRWDMYREEAVECENYPIPTIQEHIISVKFL